MTLIVLLSLAAPAAPAAPPTHEPRGSSSETEAGLCTITTAPCSLTIALAVVSRLHVKAAARHRQSKLAAFRMLARLFKQASRDLRRIHPEKRPRGQRSLDAKVYGLACLESARKAPGKRSWRDR